ncbi:MAG TPA: hypothetical protein PKD53_13305 [Chloroflexaceae bacterium]|nr:hypothetical protein [Chloroflexaceae bacterium]
MTTPDVPAPADRVTLSLSLPADAHSRLAILAGVYQIPLEGLAAELLAASVVLCTEAEHGPALAGLTVSRGDLEALERGRIELERDEARAELGRLRAELRRTGTRLLRLAEGEGEGQ